MEEGGAEAERRRKVKRERRDDKWENEKGKLTAI